MNNLQIALWISAIFLLSIAVYIIIGNCWICIRWILFKRRETFVPFVGGIAGLIGVLLLPVKNAGSFWWVPVVLDPGFGLLLVGVIIDKIRSKIRK